MKVKFTKLAALLLAGAALFATGCTDYEVDIQKNADAIASANQQISALQTALNSLQSTHSADVAALNKAISDLETSLKALIDKKADKEALEAAIARIKAIEDADFQAQIDALKQKVDKCATKEELEKAVADLTVYINDEIAKLDTRLTTAEAAIKTINEVTIPAINEQIDALKKKDAQHDETLKLLSDYVKNLQDLTAGFPEGKTIKEYIDEEIKDMEASLKAYVQEELKKYATKAELAEVEARLDARLQTLEALTAGFPEGTTIKKYIDDQVTAINNAIAELKALHEADVEELKAAIEKVKAEILAVKQAIRSLVFVPEYYVDGVEAIVVSTLTYNPLKLVKPDSQDEKAEVNMKDTVTVTPAVIAKYHVIPSNADLSFLNEGDTVKFVVRENDPFFKTRADVEATEDFTVTGIYQGRDTLETDVINIEVQVTGKPAEKDLISVVALQLTKEDETYTSDYATVFSLDIADLRIAEPTNEEDAHYRRATEGISNEDTEAFLDTAVVWTAALDTASCDHQMAYDESFDVKEYVIAHFKDTEECLGDDEKTFEGLGFTWKFELVKNYKPGDSTMFTLEDGVLKAKDGNAINLTPVVRVYVLDGEKNVQIAYVKVWVAPSDKDTSITWSKDKNKKFDVEDQFEFKCEGDTLFADSTVLKKKVYDLFPITRKNFHAAYPEFVAAYGEADTLGTVEYVDSTGTLQWIMNPEQLWKIASDPNLEEGEVPVITHKVAFKADNNAEVVITLYADVKPVAPYRIPVDRYISNYWDLDYTFARYNVADPTLGETDSTLCVFHNNINAAFVTVKETGVIDLTGIGEEGLEVSNIKYFFCDDMETLEAFKKVGPYDVTFTIEDGTGTRTDVNGTEFSVEGHNTILKAKIDTVEAEIAYICNDADEKDLTPNVVVLVKDPDPNHIAKKLLNTNEFKVLLGATGMICGDEGFEVNLWWQSDPINDPDGQWLDHFQANYIQPVYVADKAKDDFTDAVDFGEKGSFITLKDLIAPYDWRLNENYPSGHREFGMNPGDQYYNYWEYYGIFKIFVDTDAIKTDMPETNYEVPVTVDLQVMTKERLLAELKVDEPMRNADGTIMKDKDGNDMTIGDYINGIDDGGFGFLTYRNNGTAVREFHLKVPVMVQYGWGIITTDEPVDVKVNSTIG